MLIPEPRGEEFDVLSWMRIYSLEYIDEIGIGVDVVEPTGDEERLDLTYDFRSDLGPAEEPVLPPHRNSPQCSFKEIRINRHLRGQTGTRRAPPDGRAVSDSLTCL